MAQNRISGKLSPLLQQVEHSKDQLCKVIVELSSGRTDQIDALVRANNGKIHHKIGIVPSLVVELPYDSIPELAKSRQVKRIWYDAQVKQLLNTVVPTVCGFGVKKSSFTGKKITIAVLDTGVYPHHDLVYPVNRIIAWADFINFQKAPYDDNGHGTHVAGIIAGNGASSFGKYCGIAPEANLAIVKVLDKNGNGSLSAIIEGIDWCIKNKAEYNIKIINLSFGAVAQDSYRTDLLCRATSIAWKNGIVVCTAAGNDGPRAGTINTPGINPKVITVGNLDHRRTVIFDDDRVHPTSSRGPTRDKIKKPDLLAPGTNIISLRPGGGYRSLTGTSMAASIVSGAIALILEKNPKLRPDQVKRMLLKNAREIGLDPYEQGAGVINLQKIFAGSGRAPRTQILGVEPLTEKAQLRACYIDNYLEYNNLLNPYLLFLILILLISASPGYYYSANPYFLFLILLLLILTNEPRLLYK
ncbi:MAG: S8 family peptidase [Bacteroidota bacterium]